LQLLLALVNANVTSITLESQPPTQQDADNGLLGAWLAELQARQLKQPDAIEVPINQGQAIAAAQYKSLRALIFLEPLVNDIKIQLEDKGWQVLDFSNPTLWSDLFEQYADLLGKQENHS